MKVIGVVGGTGPQGRGLAYRFTKAGHQVIIGSRSPQRAAQSVRAILQRVPYAEIGAAENAETCWQADVVVLAVPFVAHAELIESIEPFIREKVVVSCINPLGFDRLGPFGLAVHDGSALVVGAFHHLSASNHRSAGHRRRRTPPGPTTRAFDGGSDQRQQAAQGEVGHSNRRIGARLSSSGLEWRCPRFGPKECHWRVVAGCLN